MIYNLISSDLIKEVTFISVLFAFILTCAAIALGKNILPRDAGRAYAINGSKSVGKPRGAGIIFILTFTLSCVLFIKLDAEIIIYLILTLAAMLSGYLDDSSSSPWGELKKGLIDFVRRNATVPVIETGAGVCHAYFDRSGDVTKGAAIIRNAKTRRVSVCNALDCVLVHRERVADLPVLCGGLSCSHVTIYADPEAFSALQESYPAELLRHSTDESYGTEFLDYKMAVKVLSDPEEAVAHIARYGSGHSECIVTEDSRSADYFMKAVDAACVYVNVPTSFTDGGEFGLGAEIGISTQKLHARGPMGLEELNTYKWIVRGEGQTRD